MGTHPIFESDFDCLTEKKVMATVAVAGPWDGSAFSNERNGLSNSYESEYKFEYPAKMSQRAKGIKPNSKQDWSTMNGNGTKSSVYKDIFRAPERIDQLPTFKPKAKPISSDAKMNGISNYRGDYTGPMSERPQAIRPRSAHRDNATDARFSGTTTVNQSFRQFSDEERKSARMRFKRLGSSHGHVDPKNANRFSGLSTFNHDYIQHGFSKPNQIRPNENNIEFGKDEADHNTSHRLDYTPIVGNQRQAPFKPAFKQIESKYEVPYVSTTRGDYIGHKTARSANFAPDRRYEPSTTPFQKDSSYTGAYRIWSPKGRDPQPWADIAKQRTNIYAKETSGPENSSYSFDFHGKTGTKRVAIKPEAFSWSDRPKFDGSSLYQQQFIGKNTERVTNYKPNATYSKPTNPVDGLSTAMDSFRGDFVLPPKPCKPSQTASRDMGPMAKSTEYVDRFCDGDFEPSDALY